MACTEEVIIVTNIFNGRYLQGKNIGHEVINFIKDVNGNYYLWINSIGRINGRYKESWAIDVVMVRSISQKKYKVVGVATNCKVVKGACDSKANKKKTMQARHKEQVDCAIKYNYGEKEIPLAEVFKNNILNGDKENDNNIFVSLKAEKVYRPTRDIFLTFVSENIKTAENIFDVIEVKNMSRETQRGYYEVNSDSYKNLSKIIDSVKESPDALWKEPNIILDKIGESGMSVLEIAKKERDELAVSNMLAYFLSKYELMSDFCSTLFGQNESTDEIDEIHKYEIAREKNNIDILIYGKNNIYIIENKIDSMIQVYDKSLTDERIKKL